MASENRPNYVIVGLGFSAVLNHLLLRSPVGDADRLGDLSVLHIGLADPWESYAVGRLGQWPCLLSLPGFSYHYGDKDPAGFLRCDSFARATKQELDQLLNRFPGDRIQYGTVSGVEPLDGNFRVTFHDSTGRISDVIAAKIDFCTGLGRHRKLEASKVCNSNLGDEYLQGTITPACRRLMTAADFLDKSNRSPTAASICIYGSGGTAAWCVERALESDHTVEVVWVSREAFGMAAFPLSGRNHQLVEEFDFDDHRPNRNINTAHLRDLKLSGVDPAAAENLIVERRQRIEPFREVPNSPQFKNLKVSYAP